MKHKLNSKSQAGTTADKYKNDDGLMSSQLTANTIIGGCFILFHIQNYAY